MHIALGFEFHLAVDTDQNLLEGYLGVERK